MTKSIPTSTTGKRKKSLNAGTTLVPLTIDPIEEDQGDKNVVLLTIKVVQARNIRGIKGEHVNSFVRIQFADYDFKESPIVVDNINPQFNFLYQQTLNIDDVLIENFANKPITVTLIESLPKEKTNVLAVSDVYLYNDLFKLNLLGQDQPPLSSEETPEQPIHLKLNPPLHYINPKLLPTTMLANPAGTSVGGVGNTMSSTKEANQGISSTGNASNIMASTVANLNTAKGDQEESPKLIPDIELEIQLSRPLISAEVMELGNFITFKVDDMFPLPEEWSLKEGNEKDLNSNLFTYQLNLNLPQDANTDRVITLKNGLLVSPETQVETNLKNPTRTNASTLSLNGNSGGGSEDNPSGSNMVTSTKQDGSQVLPSENQKRIIWHHPLRIWMKPDAIKKFRERVMAKMPLEIEFVRELQPKYVNVVDVAKEKYRGAISVDCNALLFPRVLSVKGRFNLDNIEISTSGTAEEGADELSIPVPEPSNVKGSHAQVTASASNQVKKSKVPPASNFYRTLGTAANLEFSLAKPLLDKKKLQPITKSVSDYIPRRRIPPHVLYVRNTQKAIENFQEQVKLILYQLVKEYAEFRDIMEEEKGFKGRDRFLSSVSNDGLVTRNPAEELQRRKRFLYLLNKNGAYFLFKEQLKASVVDIVRERFLHKSPFADKEEMQVFLNDLYVLLSEQMHITLNKIFKDNLYKRLDVMEDKAKPNATGALLDSLNQFAQDSELDHQFELAERYHLERLIEGDDKLSVWFDYGCFCMRNGNMIKGEDCFKEILSRNPKHVPCLLAYGSFCCINERFEEAQVFFQTVSNLKVKMVLSYVIVGLYYDFIGEDVESDHIFETAKKLNEEQQEGSQKQSIYLLAADFLIECNAGQLAERALAHELLNSIPYVRPYLYLSRLEVNRRNFALAGEHLKGALEIKRDDPSVWAALGHLYYIQKQCFEAKNAFETVLSLSQVSPNAISVEESSLVYVRLGSIYLQQANNAEDAVVEEKKARLAEAMYLKACELRPTSRSWLGVGKACLVLKKYKETEDALSEANYLNYRDGEVWATLAILCLTMKRFYEANQCVAQAIHLKVKDPSVLGNLGKCFLEAQCYRPAAECFKACLEITPEDSDIEDLLQECLQLHTEQYGMAYQFGKQDNKEYGIASNQDLSSSYTTHSSMGKSHSTNAVVPPPLGVGKSIPLERFHEDEAVHLKLNAKEYMDEMQLQQLQQPQQPPIITPLQGFGQDQHSEGLMDSSKKSTFSTGRRESASRVKVGTVQN